MEKDKAQNAKSNVISDIWLSRRLSQSYAKLPKNAKKVLDVGCGEGHLLKIITEHRRIGYGVDISKTNIKTAKKNAPNARIEYGEATKIPFVSGFFDCVTILEVLEHVDKPVDAIKEARRVLKKGGCLVITVPNVESLQWRVIWTIWTSTLGKQWKGEHIDLSGEEITACLKKNKFHSITIEPIMWNNLLLITAKK